jgi:glycosyltransferase involved in cell wall biosynthesis
MSTLDVSVIIPTRNRAPLVRRAVLSALAAARPGDEIIVVDDGSTDDTAATLDEYAGRIRYLRSAHVGPGAARNIGIREARSALIAFLDSDDEWMPDKLELQRALMQQRPDVLFCFSDFGHRSKSGEEMHRWLRHWHPAERRTWEEILGPGIPFSSLASLPEGRQDFPVHIGDLYLTEMLGDYVCTSTMIVRRQQAGVALRFAEDLRRYQDWECFGRLAGTGPAAYLDCETQWNCDHAGSRLTLADELYCEMARLTILQRVWGSDDAFLEAHGRRYREVLALHRRAYAKALVVRGRTREARDQFRLAGSSSLAERALAALPGPAARAIVWARRQLIPSLRRSERQAADAIVRLGSS